MILLISDSSSDTSSKKIEAWLSFFNANFFSIKQNFVREFNFSLPEKHNFYIEFDDKKIYLQDINTVFYRRNVLKLFIYEYFEIFRKSPLEYLNRVSYFIDKEKERCLDVIYKELDNKKKIGGFFTKEINKIEVLSIANKVGLDIPNTLVTTSKEEVVTFQKQYKRIITKCIYEGVAFGYRKYYYASYTERVTNKIIDKLPTTFMPTFFQEEIFKKFEIRVFYLLGKCYSMAIFSQKNNRTKIDFRHYDQDNPNRNVPFRLPKEIEKKIHLLMKKINLTYGSLDFIYTHNEKFVFLEINPEGIFEMVSVPCNYNLEKIIAQQLIDFDNENKKN